MQYEVRALRRNEVETVVVEATNEAEALRRVAAPSLRPLSARPAGGGTAGRGGRTRRGGFSLLLFSQELLALLEAGLTPVEAIEALTEKERSEQARGVLSAVATAMAEGKGFSGALAAAGDTFPPLFVGLVKSAERTSNLPEAIQRYIDYQRRVDAVRARLSSSLVYPTLLALVGVGVTVFLIGYVVPRFAAVYQGSNRNLPWMSALLLEWGDFVSTHAQQLAIVVAVAVAAAVVGFRRFPAMQVVTRLLRRLPGVGERVVLYELSRLYMTLGMLLQGGLPILSAIEMARETLSPEIRQRSERAIAAIRGGDSASHALEAAGLTTPIGLRMLRVGEKTGRLGEMTTRAARFYDGQIERWVEWFLRLFEPLLMTAIGLVVGLVVVLLYMPIFDLAGSLQ